MDTLLQPELKSPPPTVRRREVRRDHPVLRVVGRILGILIVLVTLALVVYAARLYYFLPQTDYAYVRANIVHIKKDCIRSAQAGKTQACGCLRAAA